MIRSPGTGTTTRIIGLVLCMLVAGIGGAFSQSQSTAGQRQIPPSPEALQFSFAPLVEKTAPAVVNIFARKIVRDSARAKALDNSAFWRLFSDALLFGYGNRDRIESSLGSGVFVRADGVVVTNHHVIESTDGIWVGLADGRMFPATLVVSDRRTDLAVLKIDGGGEPFPFLEFGDSDTLKVGDLVLAIGNPFGIGQTVTSGIVSALARSTAGISDFQFFIQTDAAINPGNSGGAQVDMAGRLVGINTAIFSRSGGSLGIGFAVPGNMVRFVVRNALEGKPLIRPWTGISGQRVPAQIAFFMGLDAPSGVLVTEVYADSPAANAGIQPGDVVVAVNGFPVVDNLGLRYRIATEPLGEAATLSVLRGGAPQDVPVDLVAPPDLPKRNDSWLPGIHPLSGAKVASLSPALAEELGLDSGITGVVVLEVRKGSSALQLGLRPGDVIRAFADQPVTTVSVLRSTKVPALGGWGMVVNRQGNMIMMRGG